MRNLTVLLAASFALTYLGAGCFTGQEQNLQPQPTNPTTTQSTTTGNAEGTSTGSIPTTTSTKQVSILTSSATPTDYCNGADMDSQGYAKTLTNETLMDLPDPSATGTALARDIAVLSTTGQCREALSQARYQLQNGTVDISGIDAWAGSSIAFCTCKPQVEANLLRLPGVSKVTWSF